MVICLSRGLPFELRSFKIQMMFSFRQILRGFSSSSLPSVRRQYFSDCPFVGSTRRSFAQSSASSTSASSVTSASQSQSARSERSSASVSPTPPPPPPPALGSENPHIGSNVETGTPSNPQGKPGEQEIEPKFELPSTGEPFKKLLLKCLGIILAAGLVDTYFVWDYAREPVTLSDGAFGRLTRSIQQNRQRLEVQQQEEKGEDN